MANIPLVWMLGLAQGAGLQVPQEQASPEERQRRQRLAERRLTLTAAHKSADIARLLEVLHDGGE